MLYTLQLPLASSRILARTVARSAKNSGAQSIVDSNVSSQINWNLSCQRKFECKVQVSLGSSNFSSGHSFSRVKSGTQIGCPGSREKVVKQKKLGEVRAGGYGAEANVEGNVAVQEAGKPEEEAEGPVEASDIRLLTTIRSSKNYITVVEIAREANHSLAGARILLLDDPGNIHSVYYQHKVLTNSYYDEFATLVPLLPDGPVGFLGLGAGAAAHVFHHFFPTVDMHGWELDQEIITTARTFFHLSKLEEGGEGMSEDILLVEGSPGASAESKSAFVDQIVTSGVGNPKSNEKSGKLIVHIGDALGPEAIVEGGFAGLVVDLFADGRVIAALQEPQTWQHFKDKLRPGGRIMVNCGGASAEAETETKSAGHMYMEETISAMNKVFAGALSKRYLARKGYNTLALTGPFLGAESWRQALPEPLRDGIADWVPVPEA